MEYWLGVLTPLIIILAVGLLCLLFVGLRWLNGKVHAGSTRPARSMAQPTAKQGVESRDYGTPKGHGHDRSASELAHVLAAAPGYRMLSIGPWRIFIVHDYTTEGEL